MSSKKEKTAGYISELKPILKQEGFDLHRVVGAAFNMILMGAEGKICLGKLVYSETGKYYLSKIKDDINELYRISKQFSVFIIIAIRFTDPVAPRLGVCWSIIGVSSEMPMSVSKNPEKEIEFID